MPREDFSLSILDSSSIATSLLHIFKENCKSGLHRILSIELLSFKNAARMIN